MIPLCYLLAGFPINPVILYASFRASHANDQCWVVPADPYEWILNTPCLIALLVGSFFEKNHGQMKIA